MNKLQAPQKTAFQPRLTDKSFEANFNGINWSISYIWIKNFAIAFNDFKMYKEKKATEEVPISAAVNVTSNEESDV